MESSKVFGVYDSMTYENEQERLRRIIGELTLERSLELGIPRRTSFDWKKRVMKGEKLF